MRMRTFMERRFGGGERQFKRNDMQVTNVFLRLEKERDKTRIKQGKQKMIIKKKNMWIKCDHFTQKVKKLI